MVGSSLPAHTVRLTHTPRGIELYFPPLRMPEVALPLALFGIIAIVLPTIAIAALLPSLLGASGMMSTILMAGFVVPFGIFGVTCVALAFYMLVNALVVRVDSDTIQTVRLVLGIVVRRHRLEREGIVSLESEIASRYQSLFNSHPVYQLVARDAARTRVIVAETLTGDALMEQVKALIENPTLAN